ncbi:uncharacterized protein LOC116978093 [Amblyraja radiata]|uniref:uncharacterized protein LOC116978093 n=1 Tax=Amblyraja radiata TaxID=386614 RepID=UPI0014029331|nr:uncharacterized protein LOC116978093 [Amblyraja radiata]
MSNVGGAGSRIAGNGSVVAHNSTCSGASKRRRVHPQTALVPPIPPYLKENMETKAFHRDLFGVDKRCRHHRPMSSSPTSWSSPRFPLNKILDTDSGILSNASSFETYDVGKEIFSPVDMEDVSRANRYDRHGERKLTLTLLQSETRRCALTESLQTAWCALKEQRERISKKNMEVVNHGAVIDSLILKQKLLEAKVGLLHKEEETVHEVRLDEAQRDSELQNRICILEEEVERFNHRLGQLALSRRGPQSMSTVSWYLRQENEEAEKQSQIPLQTSSDSFEYHEEHWNVKEASEGGDLASIAQASIKTWSRSLNLSINAKSSNSRADSQAIYCRSCQIFVSIPREE